MDVLDLYLLQRAQTDSPNSLVSTRSDTFQNRGHTRGTKRRGNRGANANGNNGVNRGGNRGANTSGNNGVNRGGNYGVKRGDNHAITRGDSHDGNRGDNHGDNRGGNHGVNRGGNQGTNRGGNYGDTRGGHHSVNRGGNINRGGNQATNRGSNHGSSRGGNRGKNRGGNHSNRDNYHGNTGENHDHSGRNFNDRIRDLPAQMKDIGGGSGRNHGNKRRNYGNTQHNLNEMLVLTRGPEYGGRNVPEDDTKSEIGDSTCYKEEAGNSGRNTRRREFPLSFLKLEEYSKLESDELIRIVSDENSGWKKLLQTELSDDKLVLIIRIANKVCESVYRQNKSKILLQICNTGFMEKICRYLAELLLNNDREKRNNRYFWNNCNQFFNELIMVFDYIVQLMPKTAGEILPKLLTQTCITVSNIGNLHREAVVDESVKTKLEELQVKLTLCMDRSERKKKNQAENQVTDSDEEFVEDYEEPPDNFREISVRPTLQEVTNEEAAFIRPNVVKGRYQSVDHYLDVHFRLLREDFVAPLRNAICEYKLQNDSPQQQVSRTHIFNVRFYHNVDVLYSSLQQDKVTYVLQLTNKKKEKLKLENSKRLIFGSLLCLTSDNFTSITFATIANQDRALRMQGKISVEVLDQQIEFNKKYTMLECTVYFEPYYHVLKALQSITEATFPLKQYIIDVQAVVQPPAYYQLTSRITYSGHNFHPLISRTWPSANRLKMDESQFRAFHAAVTREFCVIQGPPGTGKTYIGLKVAQVLLDNPEIWNQTRHPILVICYTNHALDQFLEGILKFTRDIIRIGGRSKSKLLENFNIREQRKMRKKSRTAYNYYRTQQYEIQMQLSAIKTKQGILESAQKFDSILNFSLFLQSNPGLQNTWFAGASSVEQKKWLMGGRTKRQRNAETQEMRLKQLMTRLNRGENSGEAANDGNSDEEFFDYESDNRKLDDSDEDYEEEEIFAAAQFSILDYTHSIQNFERELLEIERAEEDTSYKGPVFFDARQAKLEQLEKVVEEYEYFKFRMEEQREIIRTVQLPIVDFSQPHSIRPDERWKMYAFWLRHYLEALQNSLSSMIKKYQTTHKEFHEVKQMEDVDLMRDRKVIGMTTTGAARFQTILQALKCPIVIVEEAAEVLESHVVVALTNACKHLILIGDHQQLRPSTVEYKLVKEYNLDISLFERMVKNGIHCERLEVQHRMRPEISRLIVPAIYPTLEDHADVQHYPNVLGVTQNIFFVTHTEFETEVEQTSSKMNLHEANFIIRLARYLLLQGYTAEDVTILTPYSGQKMFLLKERKKFPFMADLRITDVDDYQGEESKIILLTLVRSNINAKIGFLSIDNRVNVALSRAKEGLFIIGNMDNLEQAHNAWPKIKQVLVEHNQIGTHLTLRCQIHKEKETKVKCAEDFQQVPEGGCSNICDTFLTCGHYCSSMCHVIDREHVNYVCQARCNKVLCELEHLCPDLCSEKCKPCEVQVFVNLLCGHDVWMPCAQNTPDYKCQALVSVTLDCGHLEEKRCSVDISQVRCTHPCEIRRPCGHTCEEKCHKHDDPDHQIKLCKKQCTRISKDCSVGTHKCPKRCSVPCEPCNVEEKKIRSCDHWYKLPCSYDVEKVDCVRPCKKKLPCRHPCKAQCNKPCGPCEVKVNKIVQDCEHTVKVKCSEQASRTICKGVCPRLLRCGHPCGKLCSEECSKKCEVLVNNNHKVACGHQFQIPCYLQEKQKPPYSRTLLKYCTQPCDTILKCDHVCRGTCGQCLQGRIHIPCKDKCGRPQVCGHVCDIPCNETCPPCKKPCFFRCNHSKCGKTCGEPCTSCTEKCSRQCVHVKCSKLCGEECDVDACHEPCPKRLKCKHPCMGFCGDPCPPVCRICRPDDETFQVYFGNEDEPDARFVHLLECKHNIESRDMDHWMFMSDDGEVKDREVQLKKCPRCSTIITRTQRYAQVTRNAYFDVIRVKSHWFGDELQNNVNRFALINRVQIQLTLNENLLNEHEYLTITLTSINKKLETHFKGRRNPIHKILINVSTAKIQLLERILKICKLRGSHDLKGKALIMLLLLFQKIDLEESMSKQFISDLEREINRFERVLQLTCIENAPTFEAARAKLDTRILYDQLVDALFASIDIYTDELDRGIKLKIQDLKDLVDKSMVLTETERKMIVQAMDLGKGRWFTCPNGHVYCIGDCGGAMEIARCNECNAKIGGLSHALLPTNRFAGEMDGASRPAWSNNPAMDMHNFEFLD